MATVAMSVVKAANAARGHWWFEPATLRFFRSRVGRNAYRAADGRAYFVSSEQFIGSDGCAHARKYSVRVQHIDGSIDTVGEFQAYATQADARTEARRLAKGGIHGHA